MSDPAGHPARGGAPRPTRLVLVTGTATEVGKTWVSCRLAEHLTLLAGAPARPPASQPARPPGGPAVVARKPAQSFEPGDPDAGVTDAHLLAAATGDRPDAVTPPHRWYPVPMAPPMAATSLARPEVRLADLLAELTWPGGTEVGLLETAGGVRSPLAVDGDAVVLAARVRPDVVVLVADAGLGTIGAVRSGVDALVPHRVVVHLNRFDPGHTLHAANLEWLVQQDRLTVTTDVATLADRITGRRDLSR